MSLANKNGLLARLAVSLVFMALIVGFVASELFYRINYIADLEQAESEITKLQQTVASTSSIAAFLNDEGLATEVVNGLALNDIVESAQLKTDSLEISNGDITNAEKVYQFDIKSPFGDDVVGTMLLGQDTDYIQQRANKKAGYNARALYSQSALITLVTVVIVYILVVRPLSSISIQLSGITPPSKQRITFPEYHENSELGSLAKDVNTLLGKTEKYLTQEIEYRKEIQVLEQRFRLIFENAKAPIILTDLKGNIVLSNAAFEEMLARSNIKMQRNFGLYLSELFEHPNVVEGNLNKQLSIADTAVGEFKHSSEQELSTWLQLIVTSIQTDKMKEYTEIIINDVTAKKEKLEQLSHMVDVDPLTGVMNRNGLSTKISELTERNESFAVVFIDLNGFKAVNDTYGHKLGDALLKLTSSVIQGKIRTEDYLSRIGGDEFIIILRGMDNSAIDKVLNTIKPAIDTSFLEAENGDHVSVSAAFGVSFYPTQSMNGDELIHLADQAMYLAKSSMKKEQHQFYQVAKV